MAAYIHRADPARFLDRRDAGRRLAAALEHLRPEQPVVIGLPRGGVPVAYEVAAALGAPIDVLVVRKLGAPVHREFGVGAIAEQDVVLVDRQSLAQLGMTPAELAPVLEEERHELSRRVREYRADRVPVPVQGRTVIVVDDGVATGNTAVAAAEALRRRGAARVVLGVPVGPPGVGARLSPSFDEVICAESPEDFFAVGAYYEHFDQTSDAEVERLLRAGADGGGAADTPGAPPRQNGGLDTRRIDRRELAIHAAGTLLRADLRVPPRPAGLVLFAHGSGSSRLSPRNVQVAAALGAAGLATLLLDLLDEREAAERSNVFDIPLLGGRLVAATRAGRAELPGLPIGYFGASTGAAAALTAAAALGDEISAVVSRGGRPDLAAEHLAAVHAPTLLIVGGDDWNVLALNEEAGESLRCPHELAIVPHAGHLFEEPGALDRVAELATGWFMRYLPRARRQRAA
ncbi:MAG: phosphoribosyltransferase [Thermoleophilaceae bacterium]|nr:phosphoribosyltransferase [Thermoleophilaceae bacterium]